MEGKIISAKWIIPSAEDKPLENSCLVIEKDKIIDLGSREKIVSKYPNFQIESFEKGLIFPGLVNAHTHVPMTILRGLAEDLALMTWLTQYIFPVEAKLKREWVYWGTKLSLIEMIKSGITLFCDMYIFEPEVIKATEEAGLKALLGEGLFDFPSPGYGPLEKGLALTENLLKDFQNHPRIKIAVSPHTLYTCSPETIKKCLKIAEKYSAKFHIHLSENKEEVVEVQKKYGKRPVKLLYELGAFSENLIAAHCVKLTPEEIELLAENKVNIALGTDGPASNNDLDIFSEMKTACLIQKGLRENPTIITAKDVFKMATEWGAKALGFENSGKLLPGYKADLAVLDLNNHSLQPDYNPLALLVYSAKGGYVSDLMVNGNWIMKNYQILTLNEEETKVKIEEIKKEVLSIISNL